MEPGGRKFSRKRQAIEDQVLAKARKFVKLSADDIDTESIEMAKSIPSVKPDSTPKVKIRKPRWDQEKIEQRRKEQELTTTAPQISPAKPAAAESKSKKKRKGKNKKKNKKKQQEEDQSAKVESEKRHTNQALVYLQKWSTHREEWKFEKLKQIWLLKHALNASLIGDDDFDLLLNYVGSIKGKSRSVFITEMVKLVEELDAKSDLSEEEAVRHERARQILQMLHDDSD